MTQGSSARAFTLIEVVVALSLGVAVVAAGATLLVNVESGSRRQRILNEMARDGTFASSVMEQEIRQAGLGVPVNSFVQRDAPNNFIYGSAGAGTPLKFISRHLIVATPSTLGFIGDIARPDSNYSTFGAIDDRSSDNVFGPPPLATPPVPISKATHVSWHTENNGTCNPSGCSTSDSSIFFPGGAPCLSGAQALTCPWSSRRVVASERLQI
ncbi:MAG TPA: type II secretion system protein, partial [Myxococcota bacterium]